MRRGCLLIALLFFPARSEAEPNASAERVSIDQSKKVIEWGWDEPSPAFIRAHASAMDQVGFDGVVLHFEVRRAGQVVPFAWRCWGHDRFEYEEFAENISDLRAAQLHRMTDNFARFNVAPGDVDWFDDVAFKTVLHNARVAARVSKEAGLKGFMFDTEMYGSPLFDFRALNRGSSRSLSEYQRIVEKRGLQLIEAVNAEFPDITILITWAYGLAIQSGGALSRYGLLSNLLDGMLAGANSATTLVDAHEFSYGHRHYGRYLLSRKEITERFVSSNPLIRGKTKQLSVGFGLWMDYLHSRYGWDASDIKRNYFSPEEFAYSLFAALAVTDKYVWVYTEKPRWWDRDGVPQQYVDALRGARRPRRLADSRYPSRRVLGDKIKAALQAGYGEAGSFAASPGRKIATLSKGWTFRADERLAGVDEKWFSPSKNLAGWQPIEVGKFWDEQRASLIGVGWYRMTWRAPAKRAGRWVLYFGAVDEVAEVYVNGVRVGAHDRGPAGWNEAFEVDATTALRPNAPNTIAVRVTNTTGVGGIWKSIQVHELPDPAAP